MLLFLEALYTQEWVSYKIYPVLWRLQSLATNRCIPPERRTKIRTRTVFRPEATFCSKQLRMSWTEIGCKCVVFEPQYRFPHGHRKNLYKIWEAFFNPFFFVLSLQTEFGVNCAQRSSLGTCNLLLFLLNSCLSLSFILTVLSSEDFEESFDGSI